METSQVATIELPVETVKKVDGLLREIGSSRGARKAAEAELQSMGTDAARAIVSLLEPRLAKRRNGIRRARKYAPWVVSALVLWFVLAGSWPPLNTAYLFSFPVLGGAMCLWMLTLILRSLWEPSYSAHIAALSSLSDKHMIPTLLDVYGLMETGQGRIVGVLTRLLPQLAASDAYLLSREHRKRLNGFLNDWTPSKRHYPSDFIVAVLKALEQVGDKSSVWYVARLARAFRDSPVRRAARDCLPYIEARINLGTDTLLRASSATAQPGELLRAAAHISANAEEELLRADLGTQQENGDRQGLST